MADRPMFDSEVIFEDRSFSEHSKGLPTICLQYLCNSFSYYGFTAILIYYLYKEAPVDLKLDKIEATQLLSLYFVFVVICGVIGSYMADRILNVRKALRLMNIIAPIPYLILTIPDPGAIGYAVATGLLLYNSMIAGRPMNTLATKLRQQGDVGRNSAFAYIYIIVNTGSAIPAVTGTIALLFSCHATLALCVAAPVIGSTIFFPTERRVSGIIAEEPVDPFLGTTRKKAAFVLAGIVAIIVTTLVYLFSNRIITIKQFANTVSSVAVSLPAIHLVYMTSSPGTKSERKCRVLFIIPVPTAYCFMNLVSYQDNTMLGVYAETSVNMNFFGEEITPASFVTLQSIFSILFESLITGLWARLGKKQPATLGKMGIGMLCYGVSTLIMVLPSQIYAPGEKTSPLWFTSSHTVYIVGEAICWSVGISAAITVASAAFVIQMLTIWFTEQSTNVNLLALATNLYKEGSGFMYFLTTGVAVAAAAVIILILQKPLTHGMGINKKG